MNIELMAGYRPYSYQYETSPRKLQPDYEVRGNNTVKRKKSTLNTKKNKVGNNQVKKNSSKTKKKNKVQLQTSSLYSIWLCYAMHHKL